MFSPGKPSQAERARDGVGAAVAWVTKLGPSSLKLRQAENPARYTGCGQYRLAPRERGTVPRAPPDCCYSSAKRCHRRRRRPCGFVVIVRVVAAVAAAVTAIATVVALEPGAPPDVAICLLGEPRGLLERPCIYNGLVRNVFQALKVTPTVFLQLRTLKPPTRDDRIALDTARRAIAPTVMEWKLLRSSQLNPQCELQGVREWTAERLPQIMGQANSWGECYERVRLFEQQERGGVEFEAIAKVRVDSLFFAPLPSWTSLADIRQTAVFGDFVNKLAFKNNSVIQRRPADHIFIVPRAIAPAAFNIAADYRTCPGGAMHFPFDLETTLWMRVRDAATQHPEMSVLRVNLPELLLSGYQTHTSKIANRCNTFCKSPKRCMEFARECLGRSWG